ncbi:MAG: manganese efflux pump MntP family protein [Elusimicrobiales bacterium]|nr:manganese efflux pump MntP family protein [Elusimicrobiales bacterium]
MSTVEIILIAFSLSLDCFAVSISSGGTMRFFNFKNLIKMSFLFGFFQSLMPIIGYFAGIGFLNTLKKADHWIAFILLCSIGIKMIYESTKLQDLNCSKNTKCPFNIQTLLILSIATSIDALAIGFTFPLLNISLLIPILIIGFTSFIMSIIGINLGYKGKTLLEGKMEVIAGLILIIIGLKILITHLYTNA